MSSLVLFLTVFLACSVEAVEALTIVLAAGTTRHWGSALQGAGAALVALAATVAVLGPAVSLIIMGKLDPNIFLSPLMILGTQWYILFNVIAGASAYPTDLRQAAQSFGVKGWQWWRTVMTPGILPYFVTGALTASGGAWNASIVSEVASWGDKHLRAAGLGAYIADASTAGDMPRVVLGVAVMSVFVVALNRTVWRPLYGIAERRFRFD